MRSLLRITFPLILISQIFVAPLVADDVYNFYFQKAGGPQTVIQGGGPQKKYDDSSLESKAPNVTGDNLPAAPVQPEAVAPANDTVSDSTAAILPALAEKKTYMPWEIHFGNALLVDRSERWNGGSFGLRYNFTKYFGADARITYADESDKYGRRNRTNESFDGSIGLALTPIHIMVFGYDLIDIGILGGLMTARENSWSDKRFGKSYWGVSTEINFSKNIALDIETRIEGDDARYGQANVGMALKF